MIICLDAGHGGSDPGATFRSYREKDITLSIIRKMREAVKLYGHVPLLTRQDDLHFVSLGQRCEMANSHKAEVFVSIHLNADTDPDIPGMKEATGAEVWFFHRSKRSLTLAQAVRQRFSEELPGWKWRGEKPTERLYVLKHTVMPAVLVEVGFVDSLHDVTFLSRPVFQEQVAGAIVRAVLDWKQPGSPLSPDV